MVPQSTVTLGPLCSQCHTPMAAGVHEPRLGDGAGRIHVVRLPYWRCGCCGLTLPRV
jgi:hypothetical protein